MKKKIIIIVAIVVLVLAIAVTAILFFDNKKNEDPTLLNCSTKAEIDSLIESEKIEATVVRDNYIRIDSYEILSSKAKVEIIYSDDDSFYSFSLLFDLFIHEFAEGEKEYKFSSKDKEKIEDEFNDIKIAFGEYLGCELERYDIVPAKDIEKLEDTDEAFYNGDIIREYSVRDENGMLWILSYSAVNGTAQAKLEKIVDEGGFEGFIPSIDLTK